MPLKGHSIYLIVEVQDSELYRQSVTNQHYKRILKCMLLAITIVIVGRVFHKWKKGNFGVMKTN